MNIIKFEPQYRDDMIFMVLEAKNALGKIPRINDDLLDIQKSYFDKGDMFWIALDDNNRVIGCVGYNYIEDISEVWLHRLYVKPHLKHKGIGSQLLKAAEAYIKIKGKTAIHIHLGQPKEQWFESYSFYPKNGYCAYDETTPNLMKKDLGSEV